MISTGRRPSRHSGETGSSTISVTHSQTSLLRRFFAAAGGLLLGLGRARARQFLSRSLALGVFAICAGIFSALALYTYIQDKERQLQARNQDRMVERIVASRHLPAGTRLMPDDLAVRNFPEAWVASDSMAVFRHGELEGQVLSVDLRAGDAIVPAHIVRPQTAFSAQLAPGRRAITLPVDQVNSLSGLLQAGDLIDLYVSFDHQRKRLTAPLLQGVHVLATGQNTNMAEAGLAGETYSTITLDAAPDDVIKLVAARQAGTLTAILRHPADSRPDRRAARGDLATLIGVRNPSPPRQRRAVILYGSSTARALPGWAQGRAPQPRLPNGWFELPANSGLSSASLTAIEAANDMFAAETEQEFAFLDEDSAIEADGLPNGPSYRVPAGHHDRTSDEHQLSADARISGRVDDQINGIFSGVEIHEAYPHEAYP